MIARPRLAIAPPLWPIFLAVIALVVMIGAQLAHAGADPSPVLSGAIPWQLWIVAGLAALAGFETVLKGLSMALHAIAPRTKTPIDDDLAKSVDELHDKIDLVRADLTELAGAIVPAAKAQPALATVRNPQAGMVGGGMLAGLGSLSVIALIVGLAVGHASGCTKAQLKADAVTAGRDLVNCTGQALGATPALDLATLVAVANAVATERAKCTPAGGSLSWSCVESDLVAEGPVLGGCAMVKLVTGVPAVVATARLATPDPTPDPGRAALERVRAKVAPGAMFHTAAGNI
jgi:hypothetical protein